jgi:hypothetical protein
LSFAQEAQERAWLLAGHLEDDDICTLERLRQSYALSSDVSHTLGKMGHCGLLLNGKQSDSAKIGPPNKQIKWVIMDLRHVLQPCPGLGTLKFECNNMVLNM